MHAKHHSILISIVLAGVFSYCVWRDIQIEKQYTGDLRNRVVGARLQLDRKLPYFYKWHPDDGIRYYDPIKFDTTYVNAITASPFFHHLLFPIANLPQRQISRIWLVAEYLMLLSSILIAFSFTSNIRQQWAVTVISALFPFTEAWISLIYYGQLYIVFPFLGLIFLFFMQRNYNLLFSFFAGLTAIVLLLIRPTTVLFLLPFLFLMKRYSFKYLLVLFIPVVLLLSYSLLNKNERNFWLNYRESIEAQIKNHQSNDFTVRNQAFKPVRYKNWEGWTEDSIKKANIYHPILIHMEYAGVQGLIKNIFGKKIPYQILSFCGLIMIIGLTTVFYFRQRHDASLSTAVFAIFGFCVYMILDFFSPVLRMQYYTVQWIFPLLICAAYINTQLRGIFFLLVTGIVLNILSSPFIKMRHTLGEYLILFALLSLCVSRRSRYLQ